MSASASSRPSERRRRLARLLTDELGDRVGSPREARWIVEDALSSSEDDAAAEAFAREAAVRRQRGEPLQHVLGHWSFRHLDVLVDGRALVPRPETEVVVEAALGELARLARRRPLSAVADLGTGSGVIALSLATEVPGPVPVVYATDVSDAALSLAGENARRVLGADRRDRLELRLGSWYAALPAEVLGGLDLVVSNPPYLSSEEWPGLEPVVKDFDPYAALVAGPSGTECLEAVVGGASRWLAPDGCLVVEIAPHQAQAASGLARGAGFRTAGVRHDLAGRPRVLVAGR